MFTDFTTVRIFVRPGKTDFRKSVNGLAGIVREEMGKNPYEGDVFVFCAKGRDKLKVLYYERNGFCLWYKRLEEGKFPWPKDARQARELRKEEFMWLLRGIDFWNEHKKITYFHV